MHYKLGTIFFMFIVACFVAPQKGTKIENSNTTIQDTIPISVRCDSLIKENHKTVEQLKRNTEKLKKINIQQW